MTISGLGRSILNGLCVIDLERAQSISSGSDLNFRRQVSLLLSSISYIDNTSTIGVQSLALQAIISFFTPLPHPQTHLPKRSPQCSRLRPIHHHRHHSSSTTSAPSRLFPVSLAPPPSPNPIPPKPHITILVTPSHLSQHTPLSSIPTARVIPAMEILIRAIHYPHPSMISPSQTPSSKGQLHNPPSLPH